MARNTHQKADIQALIHQAALSRSLLSGEVASLRKKLDFPHRIGASLKENPSKWLLGSMASGLFASSLFRRKPKKEAAPKKHRGLLLTVAGLGVSALQPFARIWLTNQVKNYLSNQQLSINPRSSRR